MDIGAISTQLKDFLAPFLDPIGKPFAAATAPVFGLFNQIGSSIGLDPFAVLYLFTFIINFPLALFVRKLPAGRIRHLFCLIFGMGYCFFAFQWMTLHSLFLAVSCYMISMILPWNISHIVVFTFAMSYMTMCHIYRMSIDYLGWSIDFTGVQMLVTWKVISAAFNYTDGQRKKRNIELNTTEHARLAIDHMPDPLQYLSYIYFFPVVLSGPVYEIKEYLEYQDKQEHEFSSGEMLNRLAWALFLSVLSIVAPKAGRENLIYPFIANLPIWQVFAWSAWTNIFSRFKYQTAWYFGESASIAAGFGYDPEKKNWRRVQQADFMGVEFAPNFQLMVNNWNQSTSRFLRNYVYTRIGPPSLHVPSHRNPIKTATTNHDAHEIKAETKPDVKPTDPPKRPPSQSKLLNLIATFSVSALWHGLYFGYFSMFVVAAFMSQAHRWVHDFLRPIVFSGEKDINKPAASIKFYIYSIVGWFSTHLFCSIDMVGFHVLSMEDTLAWHNKTMWLGPIGILTYILVGYMLSFKKKHKKE
jgi:lysophospholipid acyltransferase